MLLKLDIQVSVPICAYFDNGDYVAESRASLIDAVESQVSALKSCLEKPGPGDRPASVLDEDVPEGEPKTFAEFRKYTYIKLARYREETERNKCKSGSTHSAKSESVPKKRRTLAYYEDMLALLKQTGAKTFAEIYPDMKDDAGQRSGNQRWKPTSVSETRPQYSLLSKNMYNQQDVLPHQLDQYDALFEACWVGDDARIEELCLPCKGKKSGKEPIQITVNTKEFPRPPRSNLNSGIDVRHFVGDGVYNPFSVAIIARKWSTARLVLAIATAQYKAPEEGTQRGTSLERVISACHITPRCVMKLTKFQISMTMHLRAAHLTLRKARMKWTFMMMQQDQFRS